MDEDKHQEITGTASIEVIRVLDDNGEELPLPFEDICEEEFIKEEEDYIQVVDMAFDSRVISSTEYAQFLDFKKRMEQSEEGSVSFKLPQRVGWGVVGTIGFFLLQAIVWSVIMYNSQMNFNEKVLERLKEIEDDQNTIVANVYTRKEEDLRYENLKLEIIKNKELLDIVTKQVEGGKNGNK